MRAFPLRGLPDEAAAAPAHPARVALLVLLALEGALLVWSLRHGAQVVSDGAGSITNGYNVSLSLAVSIVAALAVGWLPLPTALRQVGALAILGGQALHALGHLARWYYLYPWYDDALHFVLATLAAVLLLRLAQATRILPDELSDPSRVAAFALILAVALAGLWEIFEFSMDQLLGTREQDDLADTMQDMLDGLAGGVVAAAYAWRRPRPAPEAARLPRPRGEASR